jgi:hypothetical protein
MQPTHLTSPGWVTEFVLSSVPLASWWQLQSSVRRLQEITMTSDIPILV